MVITLLDDTTVDSGDINFDPGTYHFFVGNIDVTNLIRFADKPMLGGAAYDSRKDLIRLSNEKHPGTQQAGSESVTDNFLNNVGNSVSSFTDSIASGSAVNSASKILTPLAFIVVGAIVLIILAKK